MIHVNRSRVPSPPSLAAAGARERERAVAWYRKAANCEARFTFSAYKAADVVEALTALFHGKCAYCESSYAPITPVDIEHFRPKGAIAIDGPDGKARRIKPGYYWLAAAWDNLLASCPDCNRHRTHEFPDDLVTEVRGKENKFPLRDEMWRARLPDELSREAGQRLLLHPCRDRPERHVEFTATGGIRARSGSRKGSTSIPVLGLGRSELNEARRKHLLGLARRMRNILWEIERLEARGANAQTEHRIEVLLRELREDAADGAVYAGMSRQFISSFECSIRERTVKGFVQQLFERVTSPL